MHIILRIYRWHIFELNIMTENMFDVLDFTYFAIGFLPFYFCIEKYFDRTSLTFQVGWDDREVIYDYEKVIKEFKESK